MKLKFNAMSAGIIAGLVFFNASSAFAQSAPVAGQDAVCVDPVTGAPVGATTAADGEIACGKGAKASEYGAIAIGKNAKAVGRGQIVIGEGAGTGQDTGANHNLGSIYVGLNAGENARGSEYDPTNPQSPVMSGNIGIGNRAGSGSTATGLIAIGSNAGTGVSQGGWGQPGGSPIGVSSVFIGNGAGQSSTGIHNLGIGTGAGRNAQGASNIHLGLDAGVDSKGLYNLALGHEAGRNANGNDNVFIGKYVSGTGDRNVLIRGIISGTNPLDPATPSASDAIAIGGRVATDFAVAIGENATSSGKAAISLGRLSNARGDNSTSIGVQSNALDEKCVALGYRSECRGGVAIGAHSKAEHGGSVALGYETVTTKYGQVAVGGRTIGQLAKGEVNATSDEAVNGAQLFLTNSILERTGKDTAAIIGGSTVYDPATGKMTTLLDYMGGSYSSVQKVIDAIAASMGNGGTGGGSLFIARNGDGNIVITKQADGTSFDLSKSLNVDSVTAGANRFANNALTLSAGSKVYLGENVVGGVAKGEVSASSTDAVNGAQLHGMEKKVDSLGSTAASGLGGGTTYDPATGRLTVDLGWRGGNYGSVQEVIDRIDKAIGTGGNGGPAFIAKNKDGNIVITKQADGSTSFDLSKSITVDSVKAGANELSKDGLTLAKGSKADMGGNRVENVADAIEDSDGVNKGQMDKAIDASTKGVVKYDRKADGSIDHTSVTLGNGGLTTIRNVNAGSADTDAVNVSQLKEVKNWFNDRIDDNWDAISRLDRKVDGLDKRMREMGAMSAALAMMNGAGQPGLPVGKLSVGGAWGMYMNKAAFAVGAKLRTTEQISISMGISMAGGRAMGGAAFSWTED